MHGGLTFSDTDLHDEIDTEEEVTWFGFDCAHAGDKTKAPGRESLTDNSYGHFWTKEEVVEETERLAEQLNEMTWQEIVEAKLEYMPDWFKSRLEIKTPSGDA